MPCPVPPIWQPLIPEICINEALGSLIGESMNFAADVRVADRFEIPRGEIWDIQAFTTFGYERTDPTPTPIYPTVTSLHLRIFDGRPDLPTSRVVWGDLQTNILNPSFSNFAGSFRVHAAIGLCDLTRQAQRLHGEISGGVRLPEGEYWAEWAALGSTPSGPFVPPITEPGSIPRGDAIVYRDGAWSPIIDAGWMGGQQVGLPFLLQGSIERACYADCDGSGSLDFFDFLCFQNAFASGDPYADCDDSGELDFFDFLCFQNAFAAGCP